MKSVKSVLAGVAALAITGAGLAMTATPAFAATAPASAITADPNASLGTLSFYDAAGNQITSGSLSSLQYTYAVASAPKDRPQTTNQKATVFYALPDHTQTDSQNWFSSQATTSSLYPTTTAPANINNAGANTPVNTMKTGDTTLANFLPTGVMDTTAGWQNFVQVRLEDSATGQALRSAPFYASVISVDTTAGTWTQVYPAVAQSTTTTVTSSANPAVNGANVTLTANVAPAGAAGTVQFKDNGTNIGSAQTLSASGTASITTSFSTNGSHPITAVFTPTDPTAFAASTGSLTQQVNAPAAATTTTLSVSGGPTTTDNYTLTSTVAAGTTAVGAGTVAFYDNGSATALPGTVTQSPSGTFTLTLTFAAGGHSIVAKFTPTDATVYQASQSQPQTFTTQAPAGSPCAQPGSVCTTDSNIQATIPVGTLVINTPYTSAAPLDLGTMVLATDGSKYSASASFAHITVTDTRSGGHGWQVTALAHNLSDGSGHANGVINGANVGLTALGVVSSGSGFDASPANLSVHNQAVTTAVLPSASSNNGLGGTAKDIADAVVGIGTVDMSGTLTLLAPTSTEPGLYTGTITFTVG